jgi:hypothetical protein
MKSDAGSDNTKKHTAPRQLAICRNLAGGDLAAGVLLYRMVGLWKVRPTKLERLGREWLALSREDWARSAGLTVAETKNRALPRLRHECGGFLLIRTMKLKPSDKNNMIWISIDWEELQQSITPWDMYEPLLNGQGVAAKTLKYPYKKPHAD